MTQNAKTKISEFRFRLSVNVLDLFLSIRKARGWKPLDAVEVEEFKTALVNECREIVDLMIDGESSRLEKRRQRKTGVGRAFRKITLKKAEA